MPATSSLLFTSTGVAVSTVGGRAPTRQQRSYQIDCRSGSCSVYSPIGKSTVVLTPAGPGRWSIPAVPPPTDPCDKTLFGVRRAAVTMTLTDSTVQIVSNFAGYRLQGNGCFVNNPKSTYTYTGDRKPA
ncbi:MULTISPECIES: hypothetical protein [unclassified Knoellia]|uniref:hypothetical protein n=1 Tax=Knoellia altitudinis TaxID=3404795 RepID=UPI00361C2EB9